MKPTGIVKDNCFLAHKPAEGHVENPGRLEHIDHALKQSELSDSLVSIAPRLASADDILRVHTPDYFRRIAATADNGFCALTPDTHASDGSWHAAMSAVGGLLELVTAVVGGRLANGFALVRPPGHHAEKSRAMGFCLFGNVAIAAMYALETLGLQRVLIVDWDVHHGNGTQHQFENDPRVLFFSIHQYPHFPGTGCFTETGRGPGEGYSINIPIPGAYGDAEYVTLFENLLKPVALAFAPELILVSAGFDTHRLDPMGSMVMSEMGFAGLTRSLMNMAGQCCNGRLVMTLEGGYHLESTSQSVLAVLAELSGLTVCNPATMAMAADLKKCRYAMARCVHVHRPFWSCL